MLVVSIHDVAPPHLEAVRELRARTQSWGVSAATLLAVPNYHRRGRLDANPEAVAWLRDRSAAGDEVALHGVEHRAHGGYAGWRDYLRARTWTAGEGEMLGQNAPDPCHLQWERDQLSEVIEKPVHGFVAPAWLEPTGLADRLAKLGFAWHETGVLLERLCDRMQMLSPAIGFATRSLVRELVAIGWAGLALPLLVCRPGHPARVALHPGDLSSPRVMHAAELVIRRLVRQHEPVTTSTALAIA